MTNDKRNKHSEEDLKRYLYSEMNSDEIETLDEEIFLDDELFTQIVDLENDLIDAYVNKKLTDDELKRFERSLETYPARREKVAEAKTLQAVIKRKKKSAATAVSAETTAEEPAPEEEQTFWQKIIGFLTMPSLAFGMSGLLILLTAFSIFLFLDNRQKASEIARLQGQTEEDQQKELLARLAEANQREVQLQQRVENEREATGDLTEQLVRESETREKLQKEIVKISEQNNVKPPEAVKTPVPKVASVELVPTRPDTNGRDIRTAAIGDRTSRVAVNLSLPDETGSDARFTINLNDKPYLQNVAPRVSADGKKTIALTLRKEILKNGNNKLTVLDASGKQVTSYVFDVTKQ